MGDLVPMRRYFYPLYPQLFLKPGPRCPKLKHRKDRVTLQCVRRENHAPNNHLFDVMDKDSSLLR